MATATVRKSAPEVRYTLAPEPKPTLMILHFVLTVDPTGGEELAHVDADRSLAERFVSSYNALRGRNSKLAFIRDVEIPIPFRDVEGGGA